MDLEGKTALVTGAAAGIGLDFVKIMLANGLEIVSQEYFSEGEHGKFGYFRNVFQIQICRQKFTKFSKHAAILDINRSAGMEAANQLNEQYGAEHALFILCDASNPQQLEDAFKKTVDTFKRLDIVINNAGIMRDSVWEKEIAINFNGVVKGTFLAMEYMGKDKRGTGGVIVNVASTMGLNPVDVLPVYSGTKHAVVAFSQSMGAPFHEERTGVRVLTLCPSATDTSLVSGAEQYALYPEWVPELADFTVRVPLQKPSTVASGLLHILKNGKSSSVWVVELDQEAYEVRLPSYKTLKV